MKNKTPRPTHVRITEVGPRDGLQNQPRLIPTETKIKFINALSKCNFPEIEVSAFVSKRWVPQLADAGDVLTAIDRHPETIYSALVPNEKGLVAALEANADKIAVFTAASETFAQKNTNATIEQTLTRFAPVIKTARAIEKPVRAYISCVVACPYEGPIAPAAVANLVNRLLELGVTEIDLGDTIGVAHPEDITLLYQALDGILAPAQSTLHLHDTHHRAIDSLKTALALGVRSFDASVGGLGGCPFAPGAAGNVATQQVLQTLQSLGFETGIDLDRCDEALRTLTPREPNPTP